ncbi:hypothetical protein DEO72_LG3g1391 [Vigna unguiculata]|uniref:Uncharacterized protein n=1 Tax=Vigna unguiculata TaxID=3917 RepID=A0A4D6LEE7_VIGUN|nr:hypothetical protein DEO72_LG3g1391 [Vigna unguiculata]
MNEMTPAQMAKLLNRHSLADHENLAHLFPSTKSMIIARKKNSHIQHNHATKRRTASPTPSLRLRGLAQARRARSGEPPPSPRRGFDGALREHHGISLRRDPSRLSEVFPRSKVRPGRLGDLSCNSPRRAPCFISPRRD